MKDASRHPKKLQKKILRETRKDNYINGKSKEGAVAMSTDFTQNGLRSLPRSV